MKKNKKITFFYAEVTPYFFGCLKYLSTKHPQYDVEVIYLNKFANINFNTIPRYCFLNKGNFSSKKKLLDHINSELPDLLLVSGRMDNDYLYVSKMIKKKCVTVSLQDTLYSFGIKHILKKIFTNHIYKKYFKKIWATGTLHSAFALSMGYKFDNIREGFYVADEKYFNSKININYDVESLKFLFIGRLEKEKNIEIFASTLDQINSEFKTNHRFKIIGKGKLQKKINNYKCVDILGFKNIDEMINIASECHVFCLPSTYEPWGVVLHEMALLGMPILVSENCGSAFDLVQNNINGFKFKPKEKKSIKKAILKFMNLSKEKKKQFGESSISIASKINHDYWCNTLISLFE